MADYKEGRIFAADQINVPAEVPMLLKNYSKEVIKANPDDLITFSREYFEKILKERGFDFNKKEYSK